MRFALMLLVCAGIAGSAVAQESMAERAYPPEPQSNWFVPSTGLGDIPGNEELKEAQRALRRAGYKIKVDGHWGPKTRAAVKKFQRKKHVPASGELDPRTLRLLGVR